MSCTNMDKNDRFIDGIIFFKAEVIKSALQYAFSYGSDFRKTIHFIIWGNFHKNLQKHEITDS